VLAARGEAVRSGLVLDSMQSAIDDTVVCVLGDGTVIWALDDGMVRCVLDYGLFLFFFLEVDFVALLSTVDVSAVAGDMM
jgi:hypothetical protein